MTVQLILAGLVLTYIFENPHPVFVVIYIVAMVGFSIRRVLTKSKDLNKRFKVAVSLSMALSGVVVIIYFIYIAGGFKGDIDRSLSMLSEATGVPVSAIDAKGMLKIKERNLGRDIIEKEIFQSKRFISSGEIGLL